MPFLYTQAFAALASPPLQVPAVPQLINTWIEGITSRIVPLVAILIRSAIEDIEP